MGDLTLGFYLESFFSSSSGFSIRYLSFLKLWNCCRMLRSRFPFLVHPIISSPAHSIPSLCPKIPESYGIRDATS